MSMGLIPHRREQGWGLARCPGWEELVCLLLLSWAALICCPAIAHSSCCSLGLKPLPEDSFLTRESSS